MKKIFLALALIFGVMLAQAQTTAPTEKKAVNGPKMEFETSVMDYGLIEHNAGSCIFIYGCTRRCSHRPH